MLCVESQIDQMRVELLIKTIFSFRPTFVGIVTVRWVTRNWNWMLDFLSSFGAALQSVYLGVYHKKELHSSKVSI